MEVEVGKEFFSLVALVCMFVFAFFLVAEVERVSQESSPVEEDVEDVPLQLKVLVSIPDYPVSYEELQEYRRKPKKKTVPVTVSSYVEVKEDPAVPDLINHMVEHNLPEETAEEYAGYISRSAEEFGVDPYTVLAVMHVETGGTFKFADRPNSHGAIGLMQVLQSNVKCNETNSCVQEVWEGYSVEDLYDPEKNIELGTKYLSYLINRFGNDLGITAYNQGEGNVERGTYRTWYFEQVNNVFQNIDRAS